MAVVCDSLDSTIQSEKHDQEEVQDEEIWASMQGVEDSDSEEARTKKRSRKKL